MTSLESSLWHQTSWPKIKFASIFNIRGSSVQLDKESGAPLSPAWKRKLNDHANPLKEFSVTFVEAMRMMGLGLRMYSHVQKEKAQGRVPIIDPFARDVQPSACHGVPLGGMGGGTIGRGFRGDFRRWQFIPGICEEAPVLADQFSVFVTRGKAGPSQKKFSSVLYPGRPDTLKKKDGVGIGSWGWHMSGSHSTYHAVFPRAWTIYDGEPDPELKISCRQVSPFIPHNYQESSLPCAAFAFVVANGGREEANVSLLFTFANSIGGDSATTGGHRNTPFSEKDGVKGVLLSHRAAKVRAPVTLGIAALETEGVHVSICPRFSVTGQGGDCTARDMWQQIATHGSFDGFAAGAVNPGAPSLMGTAIGAAVAASVRVPPGEKREVAFSLAWDSPIVKFNKNSSYYRRYTQFYGQDGNAAPKLA
eukprot:jgi/Mesen1/10901/ME000095S10238